MTKTTAEKIAVMQAYERGEKIEVSLKAGVKKWTHAELPEWCWLSCDYRIAAPEPIPHTIDWSHVGDEFVCVVTTSHGDHYLSTGIPEGGINTWIWTSDVVMALAYSHASFKAGNMPWHKSLVVRPIYAKK